jgi:DNA-binding transcriptional regulator YiaG
MSKSKNVAPSAAPVHPIQSIRQDRTGLSRADFAALLGVGYMPVYLSETGRTTPPRRLLDAVVRVGLHSDTDELARECEPWRQDRAALLAAELRAAR